MRRNLELLSAGTIFYKAYLYGSGSFSAVVQKSVISVTMTEGEQVKSTHVSADHEKITNDPLHGGASRVPHPGTRSNQ